MRRSARHGEPVRPPSHFSLLNQHLLRSRVLGTFAVAMTDGELVLGFVSHLDLMKNKRGLAHAA